MWMNFLGQPCLHRKENLLAKGPSLLCRCTGPDMHQLLMVQEREDRKAHIKEMEHARNEPDFKTTVQFTCLSSSFIYFNAYHPLHFQIGIQGRIGCSILNENVIGGTGQESSWKGFWQAGIRSKQAHGLAQSAQWCHAVFSLRNSTLQINEGKHR